MQDHNRATEKMSLEAVSKLLDAARAGRPRSMAIWGASRGGRNLARALAERGVQVTLVDRRLGAVEEMLHEIARRLEQRVEQGLIDSAAQGEVLGRIRIGAGTDRVRGHDLVIEAGPTDRAARIEGLRVLDRSVEAGTPIASIVSGVHGYDLTDYAPDPTRVVPIHLVLTDWQVSVVEVIGAAGVARDAIDRTVLALGAAGLTVVEAPGAPGFLVDRLALALICEALRILDRGEADIESIDRAIRLHTVHEVGPLQLADLLGLDYLYELSSALATATGDTRYAPTALLRAYVENGFLGVKSGRGFYAYP